MLSHGIKGTRVYCLGTKWLEKQIIRVRNHTLVSSQVPLGVRVGCYLSGELSHRSLNRLQSRKGKAIFISGSAEECLPGIKHFCPLRTIVPTLQHVGNIDFFFTRSSHRSRPSGKDSALLYS